MTDAVKDTRPTGWEVFRTPSGDLIEGRRASVQTQTESFGLCWVVESENTVTIFYVDQTNSKGRGRACVKRVHRSDCTIQYLT